MIAFNDQMTKLSDELNEVHRRINELVVDELKRLAPEGARSFTIERDDEVHEVFDFIGYSDANEDWIDVDVDSDLWQACDDAASCYESRDFTLMTQRFEL